MHEANVHAPLKYGPGILPFMGTMPRYRKYYGGGQQELHRINQRCRCNGHPLVHQGSGISLQGTQRCDAQPLLVTSSAMHTLSM